MKKKLLAMLPVLGGVATALAEGAEAPSASTTPASIAAIFEPWITNTAGAIMTLLTAGAAIVGAMYVFRVLKRVFNGSK